LLLIEASAPRKDIGNVLKISLIGAFDHWLKMRRGKLLSLTKAD
jgi:hypothetical protein